MMRFEIGNSLIYFSRLYFIKSSKNTLFITTSHVAVIRVAVSSLKKGDFVLTADEFVLCCLKIMNCKPKRGFGKGSRSQRGHN